MKALIFTFVQINGMHSVHLARKMLTDFSPVEVIVARVWQDSEEFGPHAAFMQGKA